MIDRVIDLGTADADVAQLVIGQARERHRCAPAFDRARDEGADPREDVERAGGAIAAGD